MYREIKFRGWDKEKQRWLKADEFPIKAGYFEDFFEIGQWVPLDIMQFTGCHDRNDKEIFEGDICKAFHPNQTGYFQGYLIYDNEQALWALRTEICADISLFEFDDIEIIGNIHEHKHLLEDKCHDKAQGVDSGNEK